MGEPTPVDENTLFGIGSNTKAFTVRGARDAGGCRGRFPGTTKYTNGCKGFQMYDPYVSHEMTIRDLLTHRSGMGLGEGDSAFLAAHDVHARGYHLSIAIYEAGIEFPQPLCLRQSDVHRGRADHSSGYREIVGRLHSREDSPATGHEDHNNLSTHRFQARRQLRLAALEGRRQTPGHSVSGSRQCRTGRLRSIHRWRKWPSGSRCSSTTANFRGRADAAFQRSAIP